LILYKYLSLCDSSKVESILQSQFRFTQAKELNDKYEGEWASNINSLSRNDFFAKYQDLQKRSNLDISTLSTYEVDSFTSLLGVEKYTPDKFPGLFDSSDSDKKKYKDAFLEAVNNTIEKITDEVCIFSLTTTPKSQLMWSHYADSEKGVVIGFNSDDPYFYGTIQKVNYSNKRHDCRSIFQNWEKFADVDKNSELKKWIKQGLLKKNRNWKYENEYRIIEDKNKAKIVKENGVYLFEIPFSAWASVYYGSELNQYIEKRFQIMLSKKNHIKRYKVFKSKKKIML